MNQTISISKTLNLPEKSISNTLKLLEEGATIPFIARYRKETTGNLNEVEIFEIQKEFHRIQLLESRREFILETIESQGKLTPELKQQLLAATTLTQLEDLYLPYKPKRKSKAQKAIDAGLAPLADFLIKQTQTAPKSIAQKYISDEFPSAEDCLEGAVEILAERISMDQVNRNAVRTSFDRYATFHSTKKRGTKEGEELYKDYFDFHQKLEKCPAHRILATMRGQKEGYLNISIDIDPSFILQKMQRRYVQSHSPSAVYIEESIDRAYQNYLAPQIESEFMEIAKERADKESIAIFGKNLQQLLLAPPFGAKTVLGIDPGFRTGCKVVVVDPTGKLLHYDTIYPHPPIQKKEEAEHKILDLIARYLPEAIAIGDGTAGRETEDWLKSIKLKEKVPQLISVNEAGASIYSASEVAREEFPTHDATVRGAVSIARRLIDPLAELVKIDPKSIGVGQYQHDVNQKWLKEELDYTVMMVVNTVGVELNTASKWLLQYISGIGSTIAANIVKYREEKGGFTSRQELLKVPRLGEKAFEQCAGFLRVQSSQNPLDNTQVHPERYELVAKMAKSINVTVKDLIQNPEKLNQIDLKSFVSAELGMETLLQIIKELAKPTRDPREFYKPIEFDNKIRTIEDLAVGSRLVGQVTNMTKFGAFVNIGLKNDALLHISQISNSYIQSPSEVLSLGMQISVKVLEIDLARNRVNLTMK